MQQTYQCNNILIIQYYQIYICISNQKFENHKSYMKKASRQDVKLATEYINDLQDADISKRIKAVQNLAFIAKTLGNDRVIKELIPYIREQIINDETAVIMQVLQQIYKVAKIIGGGVNSVVLLPLLQDLIESEQQKIRKKVIRILYKAISQYYQLIIICEIKKTQNFIVSSLKRLLALQYLQAREAFTYVLARELGNFSPNYQSQFLAIYQTMAESQTVLIRKFAVAHLSQLVNWIKVNEPVIIKIVEIMFKQKQQSNRIFLVDTVIQLAKIKPPSFMQVYFNIVSYQFTWRVRYQLIAKIGLLAQAMGKQSFKSFLSYIVKYINDIQPQIRSISCLKLQQLCSFIQIDDIISRILPALKSLCQDQHVYVKHSLSSSLLHLCKIVGKKHTAQLILPKFLILLKDQNEQIRLNVFKNVGLICDVLGVETLAQTTMPVLYQLIAHANWRIRAESIGLFFYFIKNSNKQFMDDKNIKLAIDFIRDRAFAVRKEGIQLLRSILKHFQSTWFQKNIMSKLLLIFKATSYLQRQTILLTMQSLIPQLSIQYVTKHIYPNVKQLSSDKVQNVRLSSLTTLMVLIQVLPKQKQTIKKITKKMVGEDSDKDVREFAEKMLKQIN